MYHFSPDFMGSLDIARTYAEHCRHPYLGDIHLVYGMAKNPSLHCQEYLAKKLSQIEAALGKISVISKSSYDSDQIHPDRSLLKWLREANAKSTELGAKEISEKHILQCVPKSVAVYFADLDKDYLRQDKKNKKEQQPDFLVNLNERALGGKIDPVIGRQKEIRSILEVLGRKSKNNPILLGEAGVGKTAVVEGLASLIVKKEVAEHFLDKTIYGLDLSALMAGTKYRGDFEERLQKLLRFVDSQEGRAIIFFDEIHTLIGAGKSEGAIDGANLLKPALARGDLKCIGATTQDEYQKYIMKDSALDRRFRPISILEPSVEASIEILLGLKDRFEAHHGISIDSDALYGAVFFADQYIQHRKLPDKAIDLIDESCSAKKFSTQSIPNDLMELQAELRSKRTLSKTEKCDDRLLKQIENLDKEYNEKKEKWSADLKQMREFASLKKSIDALSFEQEAAEKAGDYEKASRLKYAEIPSLTEKLSHYSVSTSLRREDVAEVLSRQTGIPKEKILATKQEKILQLQTFLESRVFGQKEALHEIAETLISAYAGLSDTSRPLGSFLLMGPSGVGKTQTAKALSEFFFESEDHVIRVDLSEYSEKHSIAKLIGSPSGYVGYDEGGYLTEALRKHPYSIVLFDELEKAHPSFADLLLQILDDGRLTDNRGRTVSFHHSCILLTTNSKDITADFKPEVLGRLDAILQYHSLDKSVMDRLIDRELESLNARLLSKSITVSLHESLKSLLAQNGYNPAYGARPLKAYFQRKVIRPIAHKLLMGSLKKGHINLRAKNDGQDVEMLYHHELDSA